MFIGHFAVAFAAKTKAPQLSLGALFMAAQLLDLIWPVLLLLGLEQVEVEPGNTVVTPFHFVHYPYSHSLLTTLIWAVLLALCFYVAKRHLQSFYTIVLVVVSHWLLDFFTHRPDLPLYPGSGMFLGLGLWNSLWGTLVIEGGLFACGVALYQKFTRAKDKQGRYGLWALVGFLVMVYAGNLFGPPPPSDTTAIAASGFSIWLLIYWAYWVDRHREVY